MSFSAVLHIASRFPAITLDLVVSSSLACIWETEPFLVYLQPSYRSIRSVFSWAFEPNGGSGGIRNRWTASLSSVFRRRPPSIDKLLRFAFWRNFSCTRDKGFRIVSGEQRPGNVGRFPYDMFPLQRNDPWIPNTGRGFPWGE